MQGQIVNITYCTHMNNTPCTAALIFCLQPQMTISTQFSKYLLEQRDRRQKKCFSKQDKRTEQQNNLSKQTLVT